MHAHFPGYHRGRNYPRPAWGCTNGTARSVENTPLAWSHQDRGVWESGDPIHDSGGGARAAAWDWSEGDWALWPVQLQGLTAPSPTGGPRVAILHWGFSILRMRGPGTRGVIQCLFDDGLLSAAPDLIACVASIYPPRRWDRARPFRGALHARAPGSRDQLGAQNRPTCGASMAELGCL